MMDSKCISIDFRYRTYKCLKDSKGISKQQFDNFQIYMGARETIGNTKYRKKIQQSFRNPKKDTQKVD